MWSDDVCKSVVKELLFCLPHEWVGTLASEDPTSWCDMPEPQLESALGDWCKRVGVERDGVAGLSVRGDTAPFHTRRGNVLFLLWGLRSGLLGRWWITILGARSVWRCGCKGLHTLDKVWPIAGWSFQQLLLGVYPTHDNEGKEFKNPWRRDRAGRRLPIRAGILQLNGDWPWRSHISS